MGLSLSIEKRDDEWYAAVRGVPGTGTTAPTRDEAVAGALRNLSVKVERHELAADLDRFVSEPPPAGLKSFTGADFLGLWTLLPRAGAAWADAVEEGVPGQASILEEPSSWER